MTAPEARKIVNGELALSLVDTAAVGYDPAWQTPDGTPIATVTVAAYTDGPASASWKCQVTEAFVSASPNNSTEEIASGWCGVGRTVNTVTESSFALNLTWVQDEWAEGGGLVGFSYDNDAKEAYFLIAGDTAAGAARLAGRCWISAGQVFGVANAINTSTATWPCDRKPDRLWPTVTPLAAETPAETPDTARTDVAA